MMKHWKAVPALLLALCLCAGPAPAEEDDSGLKEIPETVYIEITNESRDIGV